MKSIVSKENVNQKVQNQLELVNKADKYVDIDQKIYENYIERKQVTGWAKSSISAAKMPPSVLFGFSNPKGTAPASSLAGGGKTASGTTFGNMRN